MLICKVFFRLYVADTFWARILSKHMDMLFLGAKQVDKDKIYI